MSRDCFVTLPAEEAVENWGERLEGTYALSNGKAWKWTANGWGGRFAAVSSSLEMGNDKLHLISNETDTDRGPMGLVVFPQFFHFVL